MPIERWIRTGAHGAQWATHNWLSVAGGVVIVCLIVAGMQDHYRSRRQQGLRKTSAKRALTVKVAARLGWKDAAGKFVETWPRDPSATNVPVVFRHPPEHVLKPADRQFIAEVIGSLLGGEWSHQPSTGDALHNRVRFTRDAPPAELPTRVDFATLPQARNRVALGVTQTGAPLVWDVTRNDTPHALIAGRTGSGKSNVMRLMAAQMAVGGALLDVCDPKMAGDFDEFAELPMFRVWTAPQDMADTVIRFRDEMMARNQMPKRVRERALADGSLPRLVLLIDEGADFVGALEQAHQEAGGKGKPPALNALASVLRMGRAAGTHVIEGCQQPNFTVTMGTEGRAQFGFKLGCGKLDGPLKRMMFGDYEPPVAPVGDGRAVHEDAPGEFVLAQVAFLDEVAAAAIAATGAGRHGPCEGQSPSQCEEDSSQLAAPESRRPTPESAPEPLSLVKDPDDGSARAEPKPPEPPELVALTCAQCGEGFTSRSATVAQCPSCGKRQRIPAGLRRSATA